MAEYELVHEIKNLCRNNQMRDIFFEEIACDDPEAYVRQKYAGKVMELTVEEMEIASIAEPPVASIGSSTITSRSLVSGGSLL